MKKYRESLRTQTGVFSFRGGRYYDSAFVAPLSSERGGATITAHLSAHAPGQGTLDVAVAEVGVLTAGGAVERVGCVGCPPVGSSGLGWVGLVGCSVPTGLPVGLSTPGGCGALVLDSHGPPSPHGGVVVVVVTGGVVVVWSVVVVTGGVDDDGFSGVPSGVRMSGFEALGMSGTPIMSSDWNLHFSRNLYSFPFLSL